MRPNLLLKVIRRSWQLPFGVPSDLARFLDQGVLSSIKWVLKYFKRRLFCFFFVEFLGWLPETEKISPDHKRILWINWSAPSLGDSLMDLSSRIMLRGRCVTLLTHPKNISLYIDDEWFDHVFSDHRVLLAEFGKNAFDLVICDSFSPRVLIKKCCVAPTVEFCGLYGYLNGFEVHRTLFAFYRMRDLLGLSSIETSLRPYLTLGGGIGQASEYDVCLAVGGEWKFRTYSRWVDVALQLERWGLSVVLVGSSNGKADSDSIIERCSSVTSTVGRLELKQVAQLIGRCKLFVGADGGLWHLASAIPIPTVVLFADCQIFGGNGVRVTRETKDMDCFVLYDKNAVSNIRPCKITEQIATVFGIEESVSRVI